MKKYRLLIHLIISLFLVVSCSDDEELNPIVDENGLTQNITDLVPQYILDEMEALGMPINGGANPPLIENNTYYASPFILVDSNRPSDTPGMSFNPFKVTFSSQNNSDLTIMVDYVNGSESGSGIGSFIVGENCNFSVFVDSEFSHTQGSVAQGVYVISGKLINNGIEDLYLANFMIDNFGNPQNVWIENGEGRVIYDQDGFSELLNGESEWYTGLPDCPCEYTEDLDGMEEMCGEWLDCGSTSQTYHYGASYEIRWKPNQANKPGQQCTYDNNRKLITSGIGAGSPDKDSPDICGFFDILTGEGLFDLDHYNDDVKPWLSGTSVSVPCWQYLQEWPANNGKGCAPSNTVSGINHMLTMIGDMTCEEATLFIKSAMEDISPVLIDAELRSYIIGESINLTNAQLINKLINWKNLNSCFLFPNDAICTLIDQAISNLQ